MVFAGWSVRVEFPSSFTLQLRPREQTTTLALSDREPYPFSTLATVSTSRPTLVPFSSVCLVSLPASQLEFLDPPSPRKPLAPAHDLRPSLNSYVPRVSQASPDQCALSLVPHCPCACVCGQKWLSCEGEDTDTTRFFRFLHGHLVTHSPDTPYAYRPQSASSDRASFDHILSRPFHHVVPYHGNGAYVVPGCREHTSSSTDPLMGSSSKADPPSLGHRLVHHPLIGTRQGHP